MTFALFLYDGCLRVKGKDAGRVCLFEGILLTPDPGHFHHQARNVSSGKIPCFNDLDSVFQMITQETI